MEKKRACPKMCRRFDMKALEARNFVFFDKNRCIFRMQSDQNTNSVQNIQEDDETQEKYEKNNACDTKEEESREEKKPSYIHIIFFIEY